MFDFLTTQSRIDKKTLINYLKNLTLLYIEDDDDIRESLSQVLARRVKKLLIARDGMEGLLLFNEAHPDIVITDVKMPRMTGLEMIEGIRESDHDVPIVLTTAFRESDYFLKAIEFDIDEYILKPIDIAMLSRVLLKCAKLLRDRTYASLARTTFETFTSAVLVTDHFHHIVTLNPKFIETFGYTEEELYYKKVDSLNSGKQDEAFYEQFYFNLSELGYWEGEIWNRTKTGEIKIQWLTVNVSKNLRLANYIYVFNHLTDTQIENKKLKHQAYHDPLTDLPNRSLLLDRLAESIAFSKRFNKKIAVLFLDLNGFKPINDQYGHHVGDILLQQVGRRLSKLIKNFDTLGRLGGDEFLIILTDVLDIQYVTDFAEYLLTVINQPFQISPELAVHVGTSIGISLYPDHTHTQEELMQLADQAMYFAKQNKLGFFITQNKSLDTHSVMYSSNYK